MQLRVAVTIAAGNLLFNVFYQYYPDGSGKLRAFEHAIDHRRRKARIFMSGLQDGPCCTPAESKRLGLLIEGHDPCSG